MSYWDGNHWVADVPAAPSRAPRIARRLLGATAEAGLITVLIFGLIAGSAFAARGGGGGNRPKPPPPTAGACSVSPNPVSVVAGGQFTFSGWGFASGELVQVNVSNSHGTSFFMLQADTSGNVSVGSYSSWTGTQTVNVYDNGGRNLVFLTNCSFEVVT